jgi:protein CpxP
MKNRILMLASIVALIIGATIFAVAQGDAVKRHFQHPGGGPPPFGPEMVDHIARELNLTDAQKAQVKTLMEAGQTAMVSLHQKMDDAHKQLELATANGQFDEAQVRALATQQGQLMAETIVEHERMKAKIYSLLTPEQRTKADEMLKHHSEHLRQHGPPVHP